LYSDRIAKEAPYNHHTALTMLFQILIHPESTVRDMFIICLSSFIIILSLFNAFIIGLSLVYHHVYQHSESEDDKPMIN
jgi:hypothetical protein